MPRGREQQCSATTVTLTDRELAVLRYLHQSCPSAYIAPELYVSLNTVRTQRKAVCRKLGVGDRTPRPETAMTRRGARRGQHHLDPNDQLRFSADPVNSAAERVSIR